VRVGGRCDRGTELGDHAREVDAGPAESTRGDDETAAERGRGRPPVVGLVVAVGVVALIEPLDRRDRALTDLVVPERRAIARAAAKPET